MLFKINEKGFTLVETMIAITIILVVTASILPIMTYSTKSTHSNQNLITASNLASSTMEEIRALDYESIGTVGGNPDGPIEQVQTRTLNGYEYRIETLVSWGKIADKSETNPVAYKNIRVIVKGIDTYSKAEKVLAELHSIASRDGEEPLAEEGHLRVSIKDTEYSPIETPLLVSITGPETSILYSDYSGQAFFGTLDEGTYSVTVHIPDDMYAIDGDIFDSSTNTVIKNNIFVSNYATTEVVFFVEKKEKASGIEVQFIDSERKTPVVRSGKIAIDLNLNGSNYTINREFNNDDFTEGFLKKEFFGVMPAGAEVTDIKISNIAGYKDYIMSSDELPLATDGTPWDCIVPEKDTIERILIPIKSGYFYEEASKEDFEQYHYMSETLFANNDNTLSLKKLDSDVDLEDCESEASSEWSFWIPFIINLHYPSENAFDGNINTYWRSNQPSGDYWIWIKFNELTLINKFEIYSESNQGPRDFSINISDNGIKWEPVDANITSFPNSTGWKTVEFASPVSCKYLKLNVTNIWGQSIWSNDLFINEIRFLTEDGYAPDGYRIVGPLDISIYEIAPYFNVEWNADVPDGASFEVRILLLDKGNEPEEADFTEDAIVSDIDGRIPNISWGQSLEDKRLWVMEKFTSTENYKDTPVLHRLYIDELYAEK